MNGLAGLSRYLSPASHLTFLPLYACSDDLAWNSRTALLEMNWTELALALTDLIDRSRLSPAPAQPMSVDHDFLHLPFEFRLLMPAYLSHLDNRPRQDFRPPLPSLLPWPGPPHLIASHAPLHPLTPFSPSAKHRIICICRLCPSGLIGGQAMVTVVLPCCPERSAAADTLGLDKLNLTNHIGIFCVTH